MDDDQGSGLDTVRLTVNNVAPTATFIAPTSVNEGSSFTLALTAPSDPSSADTTAGFKYRFDCGDGTGYGAWGTTASVVCPTSDNGARNVKGQIEDKDGGATEYTGSVAVNNVAPTPSNPQFTIDPVTHKATASFSFIDPGTADTHTASYTWTINGASSIHTATVTESNGSGTVAQDSITLPNGCFTLSVVGTVTDDDGGSANLPIASTQQVDAYTASFQAPIKDGERNLAKAGNVVPVKVKLVSSCTGAAITTTTLYVEVVKGIVSADEVVDGNTVITTSVSAADSGTQMRIADGGYIYNLSTKPLTTGQDYTIRIHVGSTGGPVILTAVLRTSK
jgi:hypothetical protein